MEQMPENVQQQIAQFQMMQQQAQAISSQKVQMEFQLKEVEQSIEELGKLTKEAEVYESIGALLIKKDKTKITKELKDRQETLELRVKTIQKQEKDIQAKLQRTGNTVFHQAHEQVPVKTARFANQVLPIMPCTDGCVPVASVACPTIVSVLACAW